MIMYFSKNLIPAPYMGERYNQHIEPQGWYFSPSPRPLYEPTLLNHITGQIESGNILTIELTDNELISNWKFRLVQTYKAKNRNLTKKLIKAGYNTILVTRNSTWLEAVYLILR
jgi:hypothetical protein